MSGCFSDYDKEDQYYERQLDSYLDSLGEEEEDTWTDAEEAAREEYWEAIDEERGRES